ncbi:DUF2262 domain-containing protein [Butyrivibrio sp. FC2001]|uniref:DUF2262 domain-containing protein n=1 Tax=Butyrivibrio sp. FC2001 TaxID=1280671 RepID=UPI0003FD9B6A|nr:DUF2262 domain-containing protein [Butyrivibrio sp. FC2001]
MEIRYSNENKRYECDLENLPVFSVDGEAKDIENAKALMEALIPNLSEIDSSCRSCAADELLEIKNDSWLEEDEEPLDRQTFADRLELKRAEFDVDGLTLWYDDDDMFWGHSIMVVCSKTGAPDFAEMLG